MPTDVLLLWEKSIAREIIALDRFFSHVIVERTCFVETGKILYEMILLSRHLSLQRMSISSGNEFLGPIEISPMIPSYVVQLIQICINLMILWWSKLRALKSKTLSQHLVYSLEFADYNLVAFSKNNYSCVVTPCLLQFFKEGSIMIIQNNLHTKISCCCLFKVGFVVMHCLLECKLS